MTEEQVLIDHIQEYLDSGMWQYEACYLNKNDLEVIIKALEKTRWISVSEVLPSENGNYLVTVASSDETATITYIGVDHYGPDWLHEDKHRTVTAWMSLPEPYRESE